MIADVGPAPIRLPFTPKRTARFDGENARWEPSVAVLRAAVPPSRFRLAVASILAITTVV